MADDVWNGVRPGDGMDDDRLLAFVLGLDDDPEVAEAAAADPRIGARLETVRAEVDRIAAGVNAAVPMPDDSYTDLADARWAGLQEYFTPAQGRKAAASRGSRRWLRVLAPVAAVALALAVGISVVERQSGQADMSVAERSGKSADSATSSGGSAAGGAQAAAPESSGAGESAGGSAGGDSGSGSALAGGTPVVATSALPDQEPYSAESPGPVLAAGGVPIPAAPVNRLSALHEQVSDFEAVVLATAQQAAGGFQDFIVLRVLRGEVPALLHLKLAGRLADAGRLHLVMLEPLAESGSSPMPSMSGEPDAGWSGEATPTALEVVAAAEMYTSSIPVVFTYEGGMAVARALPEDTDPSSVTLP